MNAYQIIQPFLDSPTPIVLFPRYWPSTDLVHVNLSEYKLLPDGDRSAQCGEVVTY